MEREILRFASQEELEKSFPLDDHLVWMKAGKPYLLIPVEVSEDFTVYIDVAFGNLFLYKGDELIAKGKYHITEYDYFKPGHPDIIVLDRRNYEVSKYIWR